MGQWTAAAQLAIDRCRKLARYSEEPDRITRTYLSAPMHAVHEEITRWCEAAGCSVTIDAAGNLRATRAWGESRPRLIIGSHLDTVPNAGAFDGILGVALGVSMFEAFGQRSRACELIGFSEEEGVRFGVPFIGSRAVIGDLDSALIRAIEPAIRAFGLDPSQLPQAQLGSDATGYLEFHIEQGPVLEHLNLPIGIVTAIAGQSRLTAHFRGMANHAGTTPMDLRRDALTCAAEWIGCVEAHARRTPGLVATVGSLEVDPGATNVVPGSVRASLDVRHSSDPVRNGAVKTLTKIADEIAERRGLSVSFAVRMDQPAVAMDERMIAGLERAVERSGTPVTHLVSGAGHDAMIMARRIPSAMLFVRSPGGISHHPDESVRVEDVEAAIAAGFCFLEECGASACTTS